MRRVRLERVVVTLAREPSIEEWTSFLLAAWDVWDDAPECVRKHFPEVGVFINNLVVDVVDKEGDAS